MSLVHSSLQALQRRSYQFKKETWLCNRRWTSALCCCMTQNHCSIKVLIEVLSTRKKFLTEVGYLNFIFILMSQITGARTRTWLLCLESPAPWQARQRTGAAADARAVNVWVMLSRSPVVQPGTCRQWWTFRLPNSGVTWGGWMKWRGVGCGVYPKPWMGSVRRRRLLGACSVLRSG